MIRIESFLLGTIATTSLAAGLFFLRFWRDTRDSLFLSFGVAFMIEGFNRCALLFVNQANDGATWVYLVRLLAFLLILAAIVKKNRHGAS